jgi:hypothetical protein
MTDPNRTEDRDKVLFAFHRECERPTAEQITEWVSRFPQFADDIRAHAAVAWDWAMQKGLLEEKIDESLVARAYSHALNVIFNEQNSLTVNASHPSSGQTFQQILKASGKEVYQLARELDIDRGVLADMFNGWMFQPACRRLVDGVVSKLNMTVDAFDSAFRLALKNPYLGHAKSDKPPTVKQRSCEEIIRSSNMSPERKRYWLEED